MELGKPWACFCQKVNSRTQPHSCPEASANAAGARSCTPLCCPGASVNVKDTCGCNFLHLAILQPKGLKNIPEEVLQVRLSYVSLLWPICLSNLEKKLLLRLALNVMCHWWTPRLAAQSSWRIIFWPRSLKIKNNKTPKTSQTVKWYDCSIIYIICVGVYNWRSYITHHQNSVLHVVSVNIVD